MGWGLKNKLACLVLLFWGLGSVAEASLGSRVLGCAAWLLGQNARRDWMVREKLLANLPTEFPMAYAVNHRYEYFGIPRTLFSAIPFKAGASQGVFDFAKVGYRDPVPTRFIVGDGEDFRALIGVDLSPGSPLSLAVERIIRVLNWSGAKDPEAIAKLLSQNVAHQLGPVFRTPAELKAGPALPWDQLPRTSTTPKPDLRSLAVHHDPLPANFKLPVVPLETMLARGEAYCMGQALLAWIVLRAVGIPARPLFGANWVNGNSIVGHTSVELEDGQIVDAAGWVVIPLPTQPPTPAGITEKFRFLPNYTTYQSLGGPGLPTWRFAYQRYLGIVLEAASR